MAEKMAESAFSVSSQMRKAVASGASGAELPSPRDVWERRSNRTSESRAHGGSSQAELEAALRGMTEEEAGPSETLFFDPAYSNLAENIVILQSDFLLRAGLTFAKNSNTTIRLCADATHDFGLQGWKLISVGLLGTHFHRGAWHVTFMPLAFAIATSENEAACTAVIQAMLQRMRQRHDFDLAEKVGAIYLDGGPALLAAFRHAFPDVRIIRCLLDLSVLGHATMLIFLILR